MNSKKYNTNEKKKLFMLSYIKESAPQWKLTELANLFKDADRDGKKKNEGEELWAEFKKRFKEIWELIDVARDT
ncbi:hypothetical protein Moror_683 [Moniliophthora roreri MCA 2997]|uniref:Uncharacterized protein n=1 Tax=Moniliophthora roreri (strain MCA 2997) TaxID=1381753 RepID=V2WJY1_MONRO|nr:hypothetical protein Moror_683 [Moniliophthora roreri MCA 2997]